eukprot:Rmarinus@m.29207
MPPQYSASQQDKIVQFVAITDGRVAPDVAAVILRDVDWKVEVAIDQYFTDPSRYSQKQATDVGRIQTLFEQYKDASSDIMGVEGMEQFCRDLQIDPTDILMLILAWKFNARTMCEFSREEFMHGMQRLGCDSIESLRSKFPALRSSITESETFRQIYVFAFQFLCEGEKQKSIPLDQAIAMWRIILVHRFSDVESWISFLEKANPKGIPLDTWKMYLHFKETVKPDLSNYDPAGAWPLLIDEYVEHLQSEKNT